MLMSEPQLLSTTLKSPMNYQSDRPKSYLSNQGRWLFPKMFNLSQQYLYGGSTS